MYEPEYHRNLNRNLQFIAAPVKIGVFILLVPIICFVIIAAYAIGIHLLRWFLGGY